MRDDLSSSPLLVLDLMHGRTVHLMIARPHPSVIIAQLSSAQGPWSPITKSMFPFCDSPSPMDIPLYQQLQLSPPTSPKPDHQSLFYYHSSPPFAADAFQLQFHHGYVGGGAGAAAAATPPSAEIGSPELVLMDQQPAPPKPKVVVDAGGGGGLEWADAAAAAAAAARKDRHSKICTAGGMRDRRMRLSLDVARKFFALQDMLGFDKASKTVQWLLNMSKGAIREVMTDEGWSECEEDGSSSLSVVDGKQKPPPEAGGGDHGEGKKPAARARKAATNPKPSRKLANAHPIPDKELRAKARERARERTREKNRMRWVTLASTINLETAITTATARAATARDELIMSPNHHLNRSSSVNAASAELEERCSSSTLPTSGGRMQETSMASDASDVIMGFGNGAYGGGGGSRYYHQHQEQQWELGGVVFANSRLY